MNAPSTAPCCALVHASSLIHSLPFSCVCAVIVRLPRFKPRRLLTGAIFLSGQLTLIGNHMYVTPSTPTPAVASPPCFSSLQRALPLQTCHCPGPYGAFAGANMNQSDVLYGAGMVHVHTMHHSPHVAYTTCLPSSPSTTMSTGWSSSSGSLPSLATEQHSPLLRWCVQTPLLCRSTSDSVHNTRPLLGHKHALSKRHVVVASTAFVITSQRAH